ncbi:DHS-like NAD/FAD-binding domain-containing protein [Phellopilus nigrolimitatus]|nr:DHS-like NAD/FAD-binding domain-containing protein [Phellopilus nigrolimitatus]
MAITISLSGSSTDATTRRVVTNLSLGVAKSKKIVVVTGAGISCSCGIPDFRSSDGLYNLVKQQYPDVVLKGRDLFDASLFRDPMSTAVFYTFISKMKQSVDAVSPSPTHHFIKTLDTKGKLLRSYTQNIDGLEERVGLLGSASEEAKNSGKGKAKIKLKDVKNVQLHGDIRRVRCTFCSANYPFTDEYTSNFLDGAAPDCPDCASRSEARVARSARALKVGKLRPAIVLYDEPHPLGDDIGSIQSSDMSRKPEFLIIMGTSLKVHGLKKLVKEFAKVVHATAPVNAPSSSSSPKATSSKNAMKGKVIFVNKTPPSSEWDGIIDYHIECDTDAWVERVLDDWKKLRPADWEVQTTLDNIENDIFKASKENAVTKVATAAKGQDDGSAKAKRIYHLSDHLRSRILNLRTLLQSSHPHHRASGVKQLRITQAKKVAHRKRSIQLLRTRGMQSLLRNEACFSVRAGQQTRVL